MRTFTVALMLALAVQAVLGRGVPGGPGGPQQNGPQGGGPQDGRGPPFDRPGHHDDAWWNATREALAACTTPLDLLEQEPETYATLLKLIKALNLTDLFSMPNFLNVTRAPNEAYFTAATMPDLSTYNNSQLHALAHSVMDLLFPDVQSLAHPKGPGGPDGFPGGPGFHGGPSNDGNQLGSAPQGNSGSGSGPQGKSGNGNAPQGKSGNGNAPQGKSGNGNAPQGNSGNGNAPQGNSGNGNTPQGKSGNGSGPNRRSLLARNGMDATASNGEPNNAAAPGGHGPGPWGPLPIGPDGEVVCPIASLDEISTPVDGSSGCPLEACLPCAGLDGCTCKSCKCSCSVAVQL